MSASTDSIRRDGAPERLDALNVRSVGALAGCVLAALLCALIYIGQDALGAMWNSWFAEPEYSHAVLIPLISAFLIWQRWPQLQSITFEGTWSGLALVCLGAAMFVVGKFGSLYYIVDLAFVVSIYAVVLSYLGWTAFRLILWPLFMLILMIPLPPSINSSLSSTLQLWSSDLGVGFIRLFGIAVYQEGNVIDLGEFKLQVVEACAGLRYLYPLMTLGFIVAYVFRTAFWKRMVIFLSSVPLTIFMNSLRIGIIGILVEHFGVGMAQGFLHDFEGWMVFMLCAAIMMGEVVIFARVGRDRAPWRELFAIDLPARTSGVVRSRTQRIGVPMVATGAIVVSLAILSALVPHRAEAVLVRSDFVEFPPTVGPWHARRGALDSVYLDTLKLDDYYLADYSQPNNPGPAINMYVAYYATQRNGLATIHTPKTCLPGGGWTMRDFGQRTLPQISVGGRPLRVNRAIIELGNQRAVMYYWFQERGRSVTNEYTVKSLLFWDALTRNRTDGAMIRLITPLPPGAPEAEGDSRLSAFTRLTAPLLSHFVPD